MLIPFEQIVKKYGKPNGILHVGANIGEEAVTYWNHGVRDQIWIEANKDIFDILKENLALNLGLDCNQVYSANFCIGDVNDEDVVFHIANNAGQSSSYLELGTHKIQHPEVHYTEHVTMKTKRIDWVIEFMKKSFPPTQEFDFLKYDFLNLDIQGAELKALRGMGDLLKQFRFVYSEVNRKEVYKGCALLPEMDAYLKGFGFRRVETAKWIGDWTDALWIKR